VPCPYCKEEIAEDTERCPECGNYLSREDQPVERRSLSWFVLVVLVLLIVAVWIFGG
jgi:predicted nucleic acid-binding Zn ribbon protein